VGAYDHVLQPLQGEETNCSDASAYLCYTNSAPTEEATKLALYNFPVSPAVRVAANVILRGQHV